MVNKRMRAAAVLSLVRKLARSKSLAVSRLARRGKGSHQIWLLKDAEGNVVNRFAITDHGSRDVSWKVLTDIEDKLEPQFGEKWMEERG